MFENNIKSGGSRHSRENAEKLQSDWHIHGSYIIMSDYPFWLQMQDSRFLSKQQESYRYATNVENRCAGAVGGSEVK